MTLGSVMNSWVSLRVAMVALSSAGALNCESDYELDGDASRRGTAGTAGTDNSQAGASGSASGGTSGSSGSGSGGDAGTTSGGTGGDAGTGSGGGSGDAGSGGDAGTTSGGTGGSSGSGGGGTGNGGSSGSGGSAGSGADGGAAGGGGTAQTECEPTKDAAQPCSELADGTPIDFGGEDPKGNCRLGLKSCQPGGTWGACLGAIAPQGLDTCAAGDDSSCNGIQNEGCDCTSGEERSCGSSDTGDCKKGIQKCERDEWGACEGNIEPLLVDLCDLNDDSNCNGTPNDGCDCINGTTDACGSITGSCEYATKECANGGWGDCEGGVTEKPSDTCDLGNDDNCNGHPNDDCKCINGISEQCGSDVGSCEFGDRTCGNGDWGGCVGEIAEKGTDTCDAGNDDTCDGTENEGCECVNGDTGPCGSDVGSCVAGVTTCVNGDWGTCEGEVTRKSDVDTCAPGNDDNCNGIENEGCDCVENDTRGCGTDKGSCSLGQQTCVGGKWAAACEGGVSPAAQDTCERDNNDNCNDTANDGCTCINGDAQSCGIDTGTCEFGQQTCADGAWGDCEGEVEAQEFDTCIRDNDDNCNGAPNESCECIAFDIRDCGKDTGSCQKGTETCSSGGKWPGLCKDGIEPKAEDSCAVAGNDDTCNDLPNEGCKCIGNESRSCNSCGTQQCVPANRDYGACVGSQPDEPCNDCGLRTCDATGFWSECTATDDTQACACNEKQACMEGGVWGQCGDVSSGTKELLASAKTLSNTTSSSILNTIDAPRKDQSIYLAADLSTAKIPCGARITGISIRVAEAPSSDLNDFRIAVAQTTASTLTGFVSKKGDLPAVVFGPTKVPKTTLVVGSWTLFPLKSPFVWDGESNLLVEFSHYTDIGVLGRASGGHYNRQAVDRHVWGADGSDFDYPYADLKPTLDDVVPALMLTYE